MSVDTSIVETAAGDLDAAERVLRRGVEELDRLGDRAYYATVLLLLDEVLVMRGKYAEAARLCPVIRDGPTLEAVATSEDGFCMLHDQTALVDHHLDSAVGWGEPGETGLSRGLQPVPKPRVVGLIPAEASTLRINVPRWIASARGNPR